MKDGRTLLDRATRGKTGDNGKAPARKTRSAPSPSPTPAVETEPASFEAVYDNPFPDDPSPDCFYGLAGQLVDAIDPWTEASRMAILIQTLVCYGSVIGSTPHFKVERCKHALNLFAVLVGQTAKGRKGTSWNRVREIFAAVDPIWAGKRIIGGLSSGEGLIDEVKDEVTKIEVTHEKGGKPEYFPRVVDAGVEDKRLLVIESEFASVLKQAERSGNVLSPVLRQAWDSGELRVSSKNTKAHATNAHISCIGHITAEELRRYLSTTEMANGLGNRILWVAVRRSKLLPDGGCDVIIEPWVEKFRKAVNFANAINQMPRDDMARELWHEVYPKLSRDIPGMVGALCGRAEAQTMRLACIYALLDGSFQIEPAHLRAALAVWDYCERSAMFIFGNSTGNQLADEILAFIKKSEQGCTRTDISSLFSNNHPREKVEKALLLLLSSQLVEMTKVGDKGRPKEIWTYVGTKKTKYTK